MGYIYKITGIQAFTLCMQIFALSLHSMQDRAGNIYIEAKLNYIGGFHIISDVHAR